MPYIFELTNLTDIIGLQYNALGFSLLDRGLKIGHPQRVSLYGGTLELELVRTEDGKRHVPLALDVKGSTGQDLIDRVNALEAMLRDAARYRTEGTGAEVFLKVKIDDAAESVLLPVLEGEINTNDLYSKCSEPYDLITELPVMVTCAPYWEADTTYTLENYIDNPGFWRGAAPGDSWAEVNAGDVVTFIDPSTYAVMGQSLRMTISPDGVNDTGVQSDAITVTPVASYYLEARVYGAVGNDTFTVQAFDLIGGVPGTPIVGSTITFAAVTSEWEKRGVTFTTPAGCTSLAVQCFRLAADSVAAGDTGYYLDAVYLTPGVTAPVGWSSGRNLVNHLDTGAGHADHLNVLCVTEIPGEVEAEAKVSLGLTQALWTMRNAKRTRDNPHNMIWQLLPRDAYTTPPDLIFGLQHASCIDSIKVVDGNAPGGHRIEVSFAGAQTMQLRTYWNVTANLASYYGKWALVLLVSKSANTDDVFMKVQAYNPGYSHREGYLLQQEVQQATANYWCELDGWEIFSFPIGVHDNDLWGAGDQWQIRLYASIVGAAAWDVLWIAGVYLVALDEGCMIAGNPYTQFAAGTDFTIDNLDGNKGVFPYNAGTATHYNNMGYVGELPTLTPKIENWLYFSLGQTFGTGEVLITDPAVVSLEYRPRGIFLRGTNP